MRKISKIQLLWMKIEAYFLEKKVNRDPQLRNAEPSPEVHEKILAEIHKRELQLEILSDEQKELIYLGHVHRRQLRRRKYWVLATAVVLALAVGMTSLGGVERVFRKLTLMISTRNREIVDSEGVRVLTDIAEEEAYAEIEKLYGFRPVGLIYRPRGSQFLEANILSEMPAFSIIYGNGDVVKIVYTIVPNYRNGSWTMDIEDKLLEEYVEKVGKIDIEVKKYLIEDDGSIRWLVQFLFDGNYYSIYVFNVERKEVDKIISNLLFS